MALTEGQVLIPGSFALYAPVQSEILLDQLDELVQRGIDGFEVVQIDTQYQLADYLRGEFRGELMHVEGFSTGVDLIQHVERRVN